MARLRLRDYILETIKPLAPGERKYWDMHTVAVKKHDEPERDEARARATNVKEAPYKGKGEDGWLKTGTDATQRDERDDVKRLGEDDIDEGRWFRTSYGWAGGAKPGGGTYKHPERVAQERREKRKRRDAFDPRKSKETKNEEYDLDEGPRGWGGRPRRQKTGIISHSLDGKSVKVKVGEHAGKTGIVKYTTREHTFSQLVPYATRHSVMLDGGHQAEFHKNHLKRMSMSEEDVSEGDRAGQDVTIHGGMREFHGKTGTITGKEGKAYRVRLHSPVHVPNVGHVRDDLWEPQHLKTIRQKKRARD